jgi:hypothetical protein
VESCERAVRAPCLRLAVAITGARGERKGQARGCLAVYRAAHVVGRAVFPASSEDIFSNRLPFRGKLELVEKS